MHPHPVRRGIPVPLRLGRGGAAARQRPDSELSAVYRTEVAPIYLFTDVTITQGSDSQRNNESEDQQPEYSTTTKFNASPDNVRGHYSANVPPPSNDISAVQHLLEKLHQSAKNINESSPRGHASATTPKPIGALVHISGLSDNNSTSRPHVFEGADLSFLDNNNALVEQALTELEWCDQGFGNRKGEVALRANGAPQLYLLSPGTASHHLTTKHTLLSPLHENHPLDDDATCRVFVDAGGNSESDHDENGSDDESPAADNTDVEGDTRVRDEGDADDDADEVPGSSQEHDHKESDAAAAPPTKPAPSPPKKPSVELFYRVGGGGGHRLMISDLTVLLLNRGANNAAELFSALRGVKLQLSDYKPESSHTDQLLWLSSQRLPLELLWTVATYAAEPLSQQQLFALGRHLFPGRFATAENPVYVRTV